MKIKMFAVLLVLCLLSINVYASSETMEIGDYGNVTDLIVITKPENQTINTFDRSYIISGYGKEGTVITFYVLDSSNKYKALKGSDGEILSIVIGASGTFMRSVNLSGGRNDILVRADYDNSYQAVELRIRALSYNLIDIFRGLGNI